MVFIEETHKLPLRESILHTSIIRYASILTSIQVYKMCTSI